MLPLGFFYSNFLQMFECPKAAVKKKEKKKSTLQGGILAPRKAIWLCK